MLGTYRILLLLLLQFICFPSVRSSSKYTVAWIDEFDDDSVLSKRWENQQGSGCGGAYGCGWGHSQQQWCESQLANVHNGTLVLRASHDGVALRGARLRTSGEADFRYGRVEVRLQAPRSGQGLWTGVWLLPSETAYGTGFAAGEIAVANIVNDAATVSSGLRIGSEKNDCAPPVHSGPALNEDFHTYAVEW
jgi:beta-glucanase (GH16 family)